MASNAAVHSTDVVYGSGRPTASLSHGMYNWPVKSRYVDNKWFLGAFRARSPKFAAWLVRLRCHARSARAHHTCSDTKLPCVSKVHRSTTCTWAARAMAPHRMLANNSAPYTASYAAT